METPHFSAVVRGKCLVLTIKRYPSFVYSGFGRSLLQRHKHIRRLLIVMLDKTEGLVVDFSKHFRLWRRTHLYILGGNNLVLKSLGRSNICFLFLENTTCSVEELNRDGISAIVSL